MWERPYQQQEATEAPNVKLNTVHQEMYRIHQMYSMLNVKMEKDTKRHERLHYLTF